MDEATAKELQKLADLRASGAISAEQYDRLAEPVLAKARTSSSLRSNTQGAATNPQQGPSMLKVAAAAGGGALAGVLAADLLQRALADPPPEVLEASFVETTTFTEDGYVTQGEFALEDASGEVIAEGEYVDQGDFADQSGTVDTGPVETYDAGYDGGGMDFSGF
jgi:hypothetical protein